MNKNLVVLVIFTLLTSNIVNAGWFLTKKDVEELKKRELLVITEPSAKFLKKYNKKPEKYGETKKQIEIEAQLMKDALKKYWKLNTQIQYVSVNEAKKIMKENKNKYAVMYKLRIEQEQRVGFKSFNFVGLSSWYDMVQITISFKPVFYRINTIYTTLPDGKITYASYLASIRYLNNYLEATENGTVWGIPKEEQNIKKMTTDTLHLEKQFLDNKLSEAQVSKYYTYPIKFVSKEEIDKAIINEQDYLYVLKTSVINMKENIKIHYIMNAKTGMYIKTANANEGSIINKKVLEIYNKVATPRE